MEYDANGNMTRHADNAEGRSKRMTYDSTNRIRTVKDEGTGDTVGKYYYDDGGFRVRRISKREVDGKKYEHEILYTSMYMGLEIQKDTRGNVVTNSYAAVNNIYLNGLRIATIIPSGEVTYYLTDQVDSVKVVVNEQGLPVSRTEFHPYGETWFQEGNDTIAPKYNSEELDKESGLYFYNARYYDAEVGRFVTADNVIDGEYETQGWNRYSYVKGNPVGFGDPSGKETFVFVTNIVVKGETTTNYDGPYYKDKERKIINENRKSVTDIPMYLVAVKHYGKDSKGNDTESPTYLFAFTRHPAERGEDGKLSKNARANPGGLFEGIMRDKEKERVLQIFDPNRSDNKKSIEKGEIPGFVWNFRKEGKDKTSSDYQFHQDKQWNLGCFSSGEATLFNKFIDKCQKEDKRYNKSNSKIFIFSEEVW